MWSTSARLTLVAGFAGLCLSGCASSGSGSGSGMPEIADARLPTEQFAVRVADRPERLALSVHRGGLSSAQDAALTAFAQKWHESGAAAIVIESPTNSAQEGDPRAAASNVAAALARMGVPDGRVRLSDYDAGGQPGAPVVASYTSLQAVGPDCSKYWGNLTSTNSNAVASHFGCASIANFAAQLADPRDLARPAAGQPADGLRRATVLDKYRQGLITSSQKDDQANGAVSNVSRN